MENEIYIVKYVEDNTIEGYVESKAEFDLWLEKHNKLRVIDGHDPEHRVCFKLIEVNKLGDD